MAVLVRIAIVGALVAGAAAAQAGSDELRASIAEVKYPRIGEVARISGDVKAKISAGEPKLISGHPMLAPACVRAAVAIGTALDKAEVGLTCHFVLDDTLHIERTVETVPRGDAVDRFFLRLFGRKTVKQVAVERCKEGEAPPNKVEVSERGIEIWVFGQTACAMTSTALIARR